jgi:transmembrane sensor
MGTDRQQIEERAAAFLQKRDTGPWTDADEAELSAWLEGATAHRLAFLRAEAAWEAMGRLKALGAGFPPRQVPSPEVITASASPYSPEHLQEVPGPAEVRRPTLRYAYKAAGIAASLLAVLGSVLWVYQVWFSGERYATPIGGLASVPLEDGSHIILNTDSKVHVVLSETERHVDLTQGEAYFEVAKDAKRPFVVQTTHTRIIAVGTQFSVRRESDGQIQLLVTEGKVQVEGAYLTPAGSGAAPRHPLQSQQNFVSAGELARIGPDGFKLRDEPVAQAEDTLAWRDGYLVFRDTSLADAVAQFNRYNARQIVITDANVAQMPLTGKFRATNSEAFISLLEQTFHIRAETGSNQIALSRSDPK